MPTLLALFAEDVPSLRLINLGGEMCPESLVERWSAPGRAMFNTYGPTEATVSASLARLRPGRTGHHRHAAAQLRPAGASATETDKRPATLLPRGDTGELCITGPGLADGYLGRPDLTPEKFLPNPWATRPRRCAPVPHGRPGAHRYRTGRCCAWAAPTTRSRSAASASSWARSKPCWRSRHGVGTSPSCCARTMASTSWSPIIVPTPAATDAQLASATLRTALTGHLPPYMVPGRFEVLPLMPRLTSGKIDRKALKAMPLSAPLAGRRGGIGRAGNAGRRRRCSRRWPSCSRASRSCASRISSPTWAAIRSLPRAWHRALRADPRFAHMTVRDIYQNRQIGTIAAASIGRRRPASAGGRLDAAVGAATLDLRRGPGGGRAAAGDAAHGAVAGAVLHLPLLHRRPGRHACRGRSPRRSACSCWRRCWNSSSAIGGKWLIAGRLKPGAIRCGA